jgi:hypothetical protein
MLSKYALLICILLLGTSSTFAQSQTTGRIVGTVTDPKGARIVGAQVTIRNKDTADERETKTDGQGNFTVSLLPSGNYWVRITSSGFAPATFEPVQVVITETTTVDADMELAGPDKVSIQVDSLLQRQGPQLGRAINSRAVAELPLATRNFTQILALSPGTLVNLADNTALGRNSQNVSVNGARVTQNNFELNSVDANNIGNNAATLLHVPAPESIQ